MFGLCTKTISGPWIAPLRFPNHRAEGASRLQDGKAEMVPVFLSRLGGVTSTETGSNIKPCQASPYSFVRLAELGPQDVHEFPHRRIRT